MALRFVLFLLQRDARHTCLRDVVAEVGDDEDNGGDGYDDDDDDDDCDDGDDGDDSGGDDDNYGGHDDETRPLFSHFFKLAAILQTKVLHGPAL